MDSIFPRENNGRRDPLKEGSARTDPERVHFPMGLDIGAEASSEIAVSIVAAPIQAGAWKD
jgi:xanthine/CO dehydrogenase XdhC/CoxF family maturation factor